MPHELPAFLQEFINTRNKINKQDKMAKPADASAVRKGEKKAKEDALHTGIAYIIENKPGRKHMEEFLQKRCDELTAEKMAKT